MNVYLHDKNDLKKNIIKYIICLLSLYLYGFYKNGILLYSKDYVSFLEMFKIVYLLILSICAYFLTNKILKKEFKLDLTFLSLFLIPLFMPLSINLFVYFGIVFIFLLFRKYYNVALVILVLSFLGKFASPMDDTSLYAFSTWDYLWGRNIGGIGSTSIVLGIIIAIVLSFTNNYKYLISIFGLLSFSILSILFKDYAFLINGNAILTILFIATIPDKSPVLKKYMIIYGLLIGILGFIFMKVLNPYYGMVLSTAVISIIYEILLVKKFNI